MDSFILLLFFIFIFYWVISAIARFIKEHFINNKKYSKNIDNKKALIIISTIIIISTLICTNIIMYNKNKALSAEIEIYTELLDAKNSSSHYSRTYYWNNNNYNSDSKTIYDDDDSEIVYITNSGSKYHRSGCSYLKSKHSITKSDAINRGYTACSRCNP